MRRQSTPPLRVCEASRFGALASDATTGLRFAYSCFIVNGNLASLPLLGPRR